MLANNILKVKLQINRSFGKQHFPILLEPWILLDLRSWYFVDKLARLTLIRIFKQKERNGDNVLYFLYSNLQIIMFDIWYACKIVHLNQFDPTVFTY